MKFVDLYLINSNNIKKQLFLLKKIQIIYYSLFKRYFERIKHIL